MEFHQRGQTKETVKTGDRWWRVSDSCHNLIVPQAAIKSPTDTHRSFPKSYLPTSYYEIHCRSRHIPCRSTRLYRDDAQQQVLGVEGGRIRTQGWRRKNQRHGTYDAFFPPKFHEKRIGPWARRDSFSDLCEKLGVKATPVLWSLILVY